MNVEQINAEIEKLSPAARVVLLYQILPNCIAQPHSLLLEQAALEEELINQLKLIICHLEINQRFGITKIVLRELKSQLPQLTPLVLR